MRQFDYEEAFTALQKKACVDLEHPLLSTLHSQLVENGDYLAAETSVQQAVDGECIAGRVGTIPHGTAGGWLSNAVTPLLTDGLMDEYIASQPVRVHWVQCQVPAGADSPVWPTMRGGHQLCMDPVNQHLLLLGGWDGTQELADLWRYDIVRQLWVCVCQDTSLLVSSCTRVLLLIHCCGHCL